MHFFFGGPQFFLGDPQTGILVIFFGGPQKNLCSSPPPCRATEVARRATEVARRATEVARRATEVARRARYARALGAVLRPLVLRTV